MKNPTASSADVSVNRLNGWREIKLVRAFSGCFSVSNVQISNLRADVCNESAASMQRI
jgi:hypothetical protein